MPSDSSPPSSPSNRSNNNSNNNSNNSNSNNNNSNNNNSNNNNSNSNNSTSPSTTIFDSSSHIYKIDTSGNIDFKNTNNIVTIDGSSNFIIDVSSSFVVTTTNDYCFDISGVDVSSNETDCSVNIHFVPIVVDVSRSVVVDNSMQLVNTQGYTIDGSYATMINLTTIDPSLNPQIEEDLEQIVTTYVDDLSGPNSLLVNEIRLYASQIQCSDFHGKGTIDDYTNLFEAAAKIANESKHIELDVDIEGFSEFANAADELSALFNGFIMKLQNVNIIDDHNFLSAIANALKKIVNLSNVFGKFKETILATSSIQIPKSAHDTRVIISGVMDEINCAMNYIGYFVDASSNKPVDAELTASEKFVINKAINTIDNWNVLCEQGLSITMSNDVDISFIKHSSDQLKVTTQTLRSATNNLKNKLSKFHYC